ncbi:MAG: glycosyl transferase family 1, partial [Bacteroidaceae bacterium]|nr:glycosyl transferase family 1 [Bacteroidaceae bacterium]
MKKLLVIRFSAMGDVAMTVPVIHSLASQHPELRITVMTRGRFAPMFQWTPANVEVMPVELENYSGVLGLG